MSPKKKQIGRQYQQLIVQKKKQGEREASLEGIAAPTPWL